jgi:hypothetical protein
MLLASLLLIIAAAPANAAPAVAPVSMQEPDVPRMTPREIKEYNATVPENDPRHIRCQTFDETGSLVKKTRVCKTNAGWRRYDEDGNDNARSTMDAMRSKGTTGN